MDRNILNLIMFITNQESLIGSRSINNKFLIELIKLENLRQNYCVVNKIENPFYRPHK